MGTSFKWNGATITARPMTIGDEDSIREIMAKLPKEADAITAFRFGEFMTAASVTDGAPPLPMVDEDDEAEAITASYQVWLTLPRAFLRKWAPALNEAENTETPVGASGGS